MQKDAIDSAVPDESATICSKGWVNKTDIIIVPNRHINPPIFCCR
jgi:hypothetical protein